MSFGSARGFAGTPAQNFTVRLAHLSPPRSYSLGYWSPEGPNQLYKYIYIYTFTHTYIYIHMHIYVYIYIYIDVWILRRRLGPFIKLLSPKREFLKVFRASLDGLGADVRPV